MADGMTPDLAELLDSFEDSTSQFSSHHTGHLLHHNIEPNSGNYDSFPQHLSQSSFNQPLELHNYDDYSLQQQNKTGESLNYSIFSYVCNIIALTLQCYLNKSTRIPVLVLQPVQLKITLKLTWRNINATGNNIQIMYHIVIIIDVVLISIKYLRENYFSLTGI